jgi:large subunit ribosomal protein L7/L12
MNDNFLIIIKQIVTDQGDSIFSNPRRVSAFFADLARDIPKPQKNAFVKCLERQSAQILKNAAELDRETCKQRLAQKLNEEEGLDLGLCGEAIELLAAVLFEEKQKKENLAKCANCGKELQEEWKVCPYCTTQLAAESVSAAKDICETAGKETELFNVTLFSFDKGKKVSVVKEIRAITGLGLKESKELVEGAPKPVKKGIPKDESVQIKFLINAAGGTAEIYPVSSSGSAASSESIIVERNLEQTKPETPAPVVNTASQTQPPVQQMPIPSNNSVSQPPIQPASAPSGNTVKPAAETPVITDTVKLTGGQKFVVFLVIAGISVLLFSQLSGYSVSLGFLCGYGMDGIFKAINKKKKKKP